MPEREKSELAHIQTDAGLVGIRSLWPIQHVAVTWGAEGIRLYLNGVRVGSAELTGGGTIEFPSLALIEELAHG